MNGLAGKLLFLLLLKGMPLTAQGLNPIEKQTTESGGVQHVSLDSVLVSAHRHTSSLRLNSDAYVWRMDIMHDLPKILGNADPMRHAQMLPGVQTNGEYSSGLHVQGCDNQHNIYTLSGVPLYNVNHLLGFFSAFNASHYTTMSLQKSPQTAMADNRLGATLDMQPACQLADTVSGKLDVGLISSQGTLHIPLGKKTSITVSGRGSYLNELYGRWLRADDAQIDYSFYDINATFLHQIDSQNQLVLDGYAGRDNGIVHDAGYQCDIGEHWGNRAAALHWKHEGLSGLNMTHTLYVTNYYNRLSLDMNSIHFRMPSGITDYGYKGRFVWRGWTMGTDMAMHNVQSQQPELSGTYHTTSQSQPYFRSGEFSLYADYRHFLNPFLSMNVGLRATSFLHSQANYFSLAPNLLFSYIGRVWQLSLGYAMRSQYLVQTGFSSIGLPTEFWTQAGTNGLQPQCGHGFSTQFRLELWDRRWLLMVDGYYKWLTGQVEYNGNFYDFIVSDYKLDKHLLHGRGHNYGISVMLAKQAGRLTGWISYSFGRALRTFNEEGFRGTYPASHERIHELNVLAAFRMNRRITLGATYVLATGTPFTAPRYFYLINGKVVAQYAEHNSNRLPAYSRLDLSLNCRIGKLRSSVEQGLNLSLYNALSRTNVLFYRMKVYDEGVAYKHTAFVLNLLPSLSYYCKF